MSLQDDGRYLELIAALASDDPEVWVAVDDLTAHMAANMSRGNDALRTDRALQSLSGAAFIVYSNTFRIPFIFDDGSSIVRNQDIREVGNFFLNSIGIAPGVYLVALTSGSQQKTNKLIIR